MISCYAGFLAACLSVGAVAAALPLLGLSSLGQLRFHLSAFKGDSNCLLGFSLQATRCWLPFPDFCGFSRHAAPVWFSMGPCCIVLEEERAVDKEVDSEGEDESSEDAEDKEGSVEPLVSHPLTQLCSDVWGIDPIIVDNVCFHLIVTNAVDRLRSTCKDGNGNYQIVVNDEDTSLELKVFDQMSLPTNLSPVSRNAAADHSNARTGDILNSVCLDGDKEKQVGENGRPNAHFPHGSNGLPQPSGAPHSSWANVVATNPWTGVSVILPDISFLSVGMFSSNSGQDLHLFWVAWAITLLTAEDSLGYTTKGTEGEGEEGSSEDDGDDEGDAQDGSGTEDSHSPGIEDSPSPACKMDSVGTDFKIKGDIPLGMVEDVPKVANSGNCAHYVFDEMDSVEDPMQENASGLKANDETLKLSFQSGLGRGPQLGFGAKSWSHVVKEGFQVTNPRQASNLEFIVPKNPDVIPDACGFPDACRGEVKDLVRPPRSY
ncbi:hypothetical protein U1Q18_003355 [Sarracenia purpurea var. burkii]